MVCEDTHLSGLGGDVDLNDILGLVDGLHAAISFVRHVLSGNTSEILAIAAASKLKRRKSYLVRERQAELDLPKKLVA